LNINYVDYKEAEYSPPPPTHTPYIPIKGVTYKIRPLIDKEIKEAEYEKEHTKRYSFWEQVNERAKTFNLVYPKYKNSDKPMILHSATPQTDQTNSEVDVNEGKEISYKLYLEEQVGSGNGIPTKTDHAMAAKFGFTLPPLGGPPESVILMKC